MHTPPPRRLEAMTALLSPAALQGAGPLARLMRHGGLHCVFQPLADLREGSVYAHEALIRGPQGSPLHTPDQLLACAARERILLDFELVCVFTALEQWGRQQDAGRLFVNISADALVHGVALVGAQRLGEVVRGFGLSARMLRAANDINGDQRTWVTRALHARFKTLFGRRVGLLGLGFKPGTDDLRNAPALEIASQLAKANVKVRAFDPVVGDVPLTHRDRIEVVADVEDLANGSDALVVVTEWPQFRELDLPALRREAARDRQHRRSGGD